MVVIIALPHLARRGPFKSPVATCQNNLKQIGIAFRIWDGDYTNLFPMSISTGAGGTKEYFAGAGTFHHFQIVGDQINNPAILICPADKRKLATNFASLSDLNISYFVGLDADERFPSMILSGDRNLATNKYEVQPGLLAIHVGDKVTWSKRMHQYRGNVLLADGSVQQSDNSNLSNFFQRSGTNLTRLAIP